MDRNEGEYRISPIDVDTFDKWAEKHPDYPHRIQFAHDTVIIVVMYPPHDGSSTAIMQQIKFEVDMIIDVFARKSQEL